HAASNRSSYTRRFVWIDDIHVERQVKAGRAVICDGDCSLHDVTEAMLVDIAHREGGNAGFANHFAFALIHVANTHKHDVDSLHFGRVVEDVSEFARTPANATCQGHAVYISTRT